MKNLISLSKLAVPMAIILMCSSFGQASEKWGTVYCSLMQGPRTWVASGSADLSKDTSYQRMNVSQNGYSCVAVGMITEVPGKSCYEARIVDPSISVPAGLKITVSHHRHFSSSLNSSDGYSCECTVKIERNLTSCR